MNRPRVAILGGGFAGLACARDLAPDRFDVTLVDTRAAFEFLPNIHEVVSGVKDADHVRLPLARVVEGMGHTFLRGRVTAIDPDARTAIVGKRRKLRADYLVVALGAADATFGVRGVKEHAIGFKSAQQCAAIHRRLERLARQGDGRVAVVGGGLEGIEALGEILRRYRGRLGAIHIVEARERLVPGSAPAVHEHLLALCREHGVNIVTGDPVEKLTAKTVFLASGRRLRSDLTVWTGGPAAPALLAAAGLAPPESWAPVLETLEHRDFRGVFVAGDAAELPSPLSKQAYHALDMGSCVAGNVRRAERGRPLRAFRPAPKPTLMTFGDLDTLLITDRITLAGPALAAGKEAVYAAVLAGLDRRPIPRRAAAVLARGRRATRRLLWPALADLSGLRRRAQLRRLA